MRGLLTGDAALGDPLAGLSRPRSGSPSATTALATFALKERLRTAVSVAAVALVLWRRSLNEVLRVRGALLPATIAPVVFMLGMSGQFGRLTGLEGFPTDSYLSWIVPLSCLQGAGFAGAATGSNLARDIEQGWFDRLLVAPVAAAAAASSGRSSAAVTRSLVPATVVLIVGLALGAELTGGVPGLLALYVACVGFCAAARRCGASSWRVTFRTQQAGPLMQQGVFLGRLPLDGLHAARCCCAAGSPSVAHLNPVTLRARDGAPGDGGGDRAEPRAHAGPGCSRWPAWSPCSARWRCAGCGGWAASGRGTRRARCRASRASAPAPGAARERELLAPRGDAARRAARSPGSGGRAPLERELRGAAWDAVKWSDDARARQARRHAAGRGRAAARSRAVRRGRRGAGGGRGRRAPGRRRRRAPAWAWAPATAPGSGVGVGTGRRGRLPCDRGRRVEPAAGDRLPGEGRDPLRRVEQRPLALRGGPAGCAAATSAAAPATCGVAIEVPLIAPKPPPR